MSSNYHNAMRLIADLECIATLEGMRKLDRAAQYLKDQHFAQLAAPEKRFGRLGIGCQHCGTLNFTMTYYPGQICCELEGWPMVDAIEVNWPRIEGVSHV